MKQSAPVVSTPVKAAHAPAQSPPMTDPSAQLIELGDLTKASDPSAVVSHGANLLQSTNPLHQIKATLQVCVGIATITVGELMSAKERQVLLLNRGTEQPVDLLLEGQVVARGQLVAVDGQFAVRITELPLALTLNKPGGQ